MAKAEIHPTASIHPTSQIGENCRIGPFAVVEEDTILGEGCELSAHSVVKRFTRMGVQNRIMEGAVIGGLPQDFKFKDQPSQVKIGDRNTIREYVTINRSTAEFGTTSIGDECFLMTGSHVAHECELGNQVVLANNVALAGHVRIEDAAFISGGVVIHQFCRIGERAMVGGNSKVVQDVPPFCLADGMPARLCGLNLVGLRRSGFSPGTRRELKRAYRILILRVSRQERLAALQELTCPQARQIADFIRHSERGYCRSGEPG